jgi:hypothetical protein
MMHFLQPGECSFAAKFYFVSDCQTGNVEQVHICSLVFTKLRDITSWMIVFRYLG